MATYKVIQDIEAEDKLVGPLTFHQFVYAGIAALSFYLVFLISSKGAPFIGIIFLPVGAVAGFFAWPWGGNQPTEVWALAKVRFLLLPRRRIWSQSGTRELVTVTAPKKVERTLTNGLSQNEVKSRLRALADTIDSRGWAIKNVNVSMMGQPALVSEGDSDRLISIGSLPQPVSNDDIQSGDMLDEQNNPVARKLDTMIAASAKAHREEIVAKMQASAATLSAPAPTPNPVAPPPAPTQIQPAAPQNNYWFLNQPAQQSAVVPDNTVTFNTQVIAPGSSRASLPVASATPTQDEETFIKTHRNEPAFSPNMHGHLHVIQPLSAQKAAATPAVADPQTPGPVTPQANPAASPVTQPPDAAILDLARNDDLNVATIAREAQKRKEPPADEVVISLH